MVQGQLRKPLAANAKLRRTKTQSSKKSQRKTAKGKLVRLPRKLAAVDAARREKAITKSINSNAITLAAAAAVQNREKIITGDLKGQGKVHNKLKAQLRVEERKWQKAKNKATPLPLALTEKK
eukprot:251256_1